MTLVFLGTPRAAVPSLRALIDSGSAPALVVTRPDRPAGRGRRTAEPPVKQAALEHGLDVFQPEKVRDEAFRERLAGCRPDALVVVAYGRILPSAVLRLAPLGAINVHFSLLPRYRGAAPVQWALARGETTTGVTTMFMNERMDEGDVLRSRSIAVEPGEHAPALGERLSRVGAGLLLETLAGLAAGAIEPCPQDHAMATLAPVLRREDGEVDPGLGAAEIEGRVRGFDPWPGVWLSRGGKRIRLVEARASASSFASALPPGTLRAAVDDGVAMVCGAGSELVLRAVQPEGRRVLTARDAINGRQLVVGERLCRVGAAENGVAPGRRGP